MNLGIANRWAIVCASSAGLGFACAAALSAEGVNVVINGRDDARLAGAAEKLRGLGGGGKVVEVPGDLLNPGTTELLLGACPEPDIVVTNNGGPRPGPLRTATAADWEQALEGNMLVHLRLIDSVIDGMCERRFGRIINITSAMVAMPGPGMAVSSAARAGLTATVKGLSFGVAPYNVTINNLLPYKIDTGRQIQVAQLTAEREGISFEEARRRQTEPIAARRLGRPEEFGAACAFLCGELAGYISGQNLCLDGGTYPALI
jgi:3-oxoacyl-[acyl-carrier protein] reductase